jgi:uncharacterized protein (DUF736 family)
MAYEMRPSSGSLFKNDKKTTDKHPNYKGRVMLPNGEERWLSAWTKKTNAGETWVSLQIGDLCNPGGAAKPLDAHNAAKGNAFVADDDSDIPF